MSTDRPAQVRDVHDAALAMPHVTVQSGKNARNPIYQVGGKSFVFFRTPRADAVDPAGTRYDDVIVIWVGEEAEKLALVHDGDSPFFTTTHFDGHPSVLVRASHLHETTRSQITELVQEAWLTQASRTRARTWLAEHALPGDA